MIMYLNLIQRELIQVNIFQKLKQIISPDKREEDLVHSNDPDIDTLRCPKCKAIWRSKGHYNYDEGGWVYENAEDNLCPCGCENFLGYRIKGLVL